MLKDTLLDPHAPCLFTGYRNPSLRGLPDVYHTISHWLESEKFRSVDETLRVQIIQAPTGKEASKIANRHRHLLPGNWSAISSRVLRSGFIMAAHQNLDIFARFRELAMATPIDVEIAFNRGALIGGFPAKWYAGVQLEAAQAMVYRPIVLAIAGLHRLTYKDSKTLVDKHANPTTVTMIIVPIAKNASLAGEEWALEARAPVQYVMAPNGKMDEEFLMRLASAAKHFLIFEREIGPVFDPLIAQAKSIGSKVTVSFI